MKDETFSSGVIYDGNFWILKSLIAVKSQKKFKELGIVMMKTRAILYRFK